MGAETDVQHGRPTSSRERILLATILVAALVLRGWAFTTIGIDHFDEGVYAFSARGLSVAGEARTLFPDQSLFSPPVYFGLAALLRLVTGAADSAAVLVNVLLGTATVGLVWSFARRTFGAPAGMAAATLLAFNEYHVGLCRTGLTDATFAFFFVLALAALVSALERRSLARAVLAGVAVGLAWNTKYHGWFAGMVAAAALAAWIVRGRPAGAPWGREFAVLAVAGLTAALCYLPWALYVHEERTYPALMAYQRTMLRADYVGNLMTQIRHQDYLEGPFTRASFPLAIGASLAVAAPAGKRWLVVALAGAAVGATLGGTAALLGAALFAVACKLPRPLPIAAWAVLGWTGVFFFSAPLYQPYARLLLPLVVAMTVLAGWTVGRLTTERREGEGGPPSWRSALAAVLVGALTLWAGTLREDPSDPWRPSRGADEAAERIAERVPEGARCVVLGEPTVGYYLHARGRPAFERVLKPDQALAQIEAPVYVIQGLYGRKAPELRDGLEALAPRLTELDTIALPTAKDHRLLDDFAPDGARAFLAGPDDRYRLRLFRLDPDGR